jgi:hypothetical protein
VTVTGEGTNAGDYQATATGLSNTNYALPAENLTQAFNIAPKTVGLTWSSTTFIFDEQSHAPTATATGVVSGDECLVTVTGAQRNAGSHTATATGLSNGNYVLTGNVTRRFTIAPRTVGLKWSRTSLVYNGKVQKPTATATGLVRGDRCTVTVKGAQKQRGDYNARATALSNRNYQLPSKVTVNYRIY